MNRLSKYMYCFYSEETQEFKKYYNSVNKEALYIGDDEYKKKEGVVYNNHIFALINIKRTPNLDKPLMFFRSYVDLYEDDYSIDDNYHMIVFRVRDSYKEILKNFKRSRYSMMYSEEYIEKYFSNSSSYIIRNKGKKLSKTSCKTLAKNITANQLNNLTLSPYAILTKSAKLREMLAILYKVEAKNINELDNEIKLEEEIYRYSTIQRTKGHEDIDPSIKLLGE